MQMFQIELFSLFIGADPIVQKKLFARLKGTNPLFGEKDFRKHFGAGN